MEENEDVGTRVTMVDDDNRPMCSSAAQRAERRCHQEVLKTRQQSDLQDKTVPLVE